MKYLKLYEEHTYNKFAVSDYTEDNLNVMQIWEILHYDEKTDSYTIVKRYEYTSDDGLIKDQETVVFQYPKERMFDDVIYQTNTIEDALDFVQLRIEAKKYNL